MHQNLQMQQQEYHQQRTRSPLSSSLSALLKLSNLEQRTQTHKHHHNHHRSLHHRRKHKTRHHLSRSGFIFIIFLSVIKDSLTTTYSTLYSSSLDVTTTAPQTNFLPYFDFDVPRNITVTVGQTGFLHCRVERLGDKDVSWIRKRDLHILTAGSTTYTSDQRFQVLRPENSGNWTLQIKYPQLRDSGIYECQINTEPKMSLSYTFNVVELKATILGPTDLYVKSGSDINLTCKIIQGPHELGNIFWYKGFEIIDMATNQNEIDGWARITVESDWSDGLTSRLKIRRASSSDTGNYTCVPTIAKSSSVYVHVIIGEHPAAMQHNSSNTYCGNLYISLCCMLFTILTCCLQHLMCTNTNNCAAVKTAATTTSASSSTLSLLTVNATAALKSAPVSASVSPSASASAPTLKSKSKTNTTMENTSSVHTTAQSKQLTLSFASYTTTSVFFHTSTPTPTTATAAAATTTCEKTRLSVCNGRITR